MKHYSVHGTTYVKRFRKLFDATARLRKPIERKKKHAQITVLSELKIVEKLLETRNCINSGAHFGKLIQICVGVLVESFILKIRILYSFSFFTEINELV